MNIDRISGKRSGRNGKRYQWITLRVSEDMKRRIKRGAKRQKRSVSAAVNSVITEFLGRLHAKQQGISFSAYIESLIERDAKLFRTKGDQR